MSGTYRKKKTASKILRTPKGHKNAKLNNARSKAIPPTSWDDQVINGENTIPEKATKRMKQKNVPKEAAIENIIKKFNLPHKIAAKIADSIY